MTGVYRRPSLTVADSLVWQYRAVASTVCSGSTFVSLDILLKHARARPSAAILFNCAPRVVPAETIPPGEDNEVKRRERTHSRNPPFAQGFQSGHPRYRRDDARLRLIRLAASVDDSSLPAVKHRSGRVAILQEAAIPDTFRYHRSTLRLFPASTCSPPIIATDMAGARFKHSTRSGGCILAHSPSTITTTCELAPPRSSGRHQFSRSYYTRRDHSRVTI